MDFVATLFMELWAALSSFFNRSAFDIMLDCIDIGLVAAIFYWGMVVLRGTRAMQMALGMVLVFIGYVAAKRFGLVTIWTLLDSLVTYFVLVVVVIFQEDIRRALQRVGRGGPLFRGQRTARDTAVIEEVIKAASSLAQKRIGGLIVFERDAELDEFVTEGTMLDATVTKELIYSIFIPSFENPMHDGAVIVRDGRVWQAGAVLPLSGGVHDRSMGTRHRAAIGISENTDAVAIVVSEEKGQVSLCFNGNIVRNLDGDSLRDAIFGLFYRPQKAKKTKKKNAEHRTSIVPELDEEELVKPEEQAG